MKKSSFTKDQEQLWKTTEQFKKEYRKYLNTLDKEKLLDEFMDLAVDRCYAAFTTDLVMNAFLENDWITEKESNKMPLDFFKSELARIKKKRK